MTTWLRGNSSRVAVAKKRRATGQQHDIGVTFIAERLPHGGQRYGHDSMGSLVKIGSDGDGLAVQRHLVQTETQRLFEAFSADSAAVIILQVTVRLFQNDGSRLLAGTG